MSKTDELIEQLIEAEGLGPDEARELRRALRARSEAREQSQSALAKRASEEIDFPVGPTGGSRALSRGQAMYGNETAAEAYERWMDQEQDDPEGVYGPGGGTAGGIFGDAPIAMPDYDPSAQRRTDARAGGQVNVKMVQLLTRLVERLDAIEARDAGRLPEHHGPRQLPRGRRGR